MAYNLADNDLADSDEEVMAIAAYAPGEMNESFTKEFLSCSICWEPYDEKTRQPKLLSCHHTFCKSCLKKLQRGRTILQCSTCRKDTEIPDGISSLQTNFYVMYMKQKFADQIQSNHNVCYKHAMQPLSFFCKTCTHMVCRDCIVLAHARSDGHDLQELNEVRAEYVLTLERLRLKVDEGIRKRQANLSCLRAELDTMDIIKDIMCEKADILFDQLVEVVNAKRQQVKDTLKETHENKHRNVSEQLVEVDNQATQLTAIREHLDDATYKGQIKDLVDVATNQELHSQIDLMSSNRSLNLGMNNLQFTALKAEEELIQFMQSVGEVDDESSYLPSRIVMDSEDPMACLETRVNLKVMSHDHQLLPNYPITMEIVDPAGDEIRCNTTDNNDGTYTVTFRPAISGAHMCTVKFLNQKISSSCITMAVSSNDPLKVIGSMGKEEGKLMYPCSLEMDDKGVLYIVDEGNQRIQKFYPDGSVDVISVAGTTKNCRTFDCALDVKHGELICSKVLVEQRKAWADTIQIFSLDGVLKSQFSNPDMKKALYVAVNSKQQIIVPDYHLNMLHIYDHSGSLLKSVGQHGNGSGEFKEPAFVCVGRNDDIILSDCRNSRVQVLSKNGEFKYQIGSKGSGKGQLQGPSGVTTDAHGHILVTDRVNNRIQVYTYEGKFVSCIESSGNKLNDPRGLAVSGDGYVYVADQKNHCIKQYKYL